MSDLTKRLRGRIISASLRNDKTGVLEMREIRDPLCVEAADRIDKLEECLRYYADTKNWARPVTYVTNGDVTHKTRGLCEMDCDKGSKARALLEEK